MSGVSAGKIEFLEGLRGIAACMVVVFHFLLAFFPSIVAGGPGYLSWVAGTPLLAVVNGSFAVSIFYVLSGFVLSLAFFKTPHRKTAVIGMLKRYPRLMLPILITNTLYLVLMFTRAIRPDINWAMGLKTNSYWLASQYQFKAHWLLMLQDSFWYSLIDGQSRYNPVLWTMKYEFFGSILVFGLLLAVGKKPWRIYIYGLTGLLLLGLAPDYLGFLAGVILADRWTQGQSFTLPSRSIPASLLRVMLLVGVFYCGSIPAFLIASKLTESAYGWITILFWMTPAQASALVLTIGAMCLMLLVLDSAALQRKLSSACCRFLGRVSFGLYLTHVAVLLTVTLPLCRWLMTQLDFPLAAAMSLVLSAPVFLLIGWLTYHIADRPAVKLSRWLGQKVA